MQESTAESTLDVADARDRVSHESFVDSATARARWLDRVVAGRFRVERFVRAHARSLVFAGMDTRTSRPVFVQVYPFDGTYDDDEVEQFMGRAATVSRLTTSYALLPREVGRDERGDVYVVLPDPKLTSLLARVATTGPIDLYDVLGVARALGSALASIHALGLAHGDVRPENLFVGGALGDAGARAVVVGGFATPEWHGARLFDAETMRRGARTSTSGNDVTVDVLGFGLTIGLALGGTMPVALDERGTRIRAPFCVRGVRFTLPKVSGDAEPVARLLARCIDPDPRARPQSITEVLQALDEIERERRRTVRRLRAARTAATAAAAVLALLGFVFTLVARH